MCPTALCKGKSTHKTIDDAQLGDRRRSVHRLFDPVRLAAGNHVEDARELQQAAARSALFQTRAKQSARRRESRRGYTAWLCTDASQEAETYSNNAYSEHKEDQAHVLTVGHRGRGRWQTAIDNCKLKLACNRHLCC